MIEKTKFNGILLDLQAYGTKGHEEITFIKEKGGELPKTSATPNWFFRLIRWLFGNSYQQSAACQKVVKFLDENRQHLLGKKSDATLLEDRFVKHAVGAEAAKINTLFNKFYFDLANDEKPKIITLSDGTILDGLFEGNYLREGTKTTKDGVIYKGTFIGENKILEGLKTDPDGNTWDGRFNGDHDERLVEGKKTHRSLNDEILEGTFDKYENLIEGTKSNSFDLGIHGKKTIVFKGKFEGSELNEGEKTETYHLDGKIVTTKGRFDHDSLMGRGEKTIVESTGTTRLEGEFGKLGYLVDGTKTLPSGAIQKGAFGYDWLKKGTMTFSDKTFMEGEFFRDKLEGHGKIIHPSGTVEEGIFKDGVLI